MFMYKRSRDEATEVTYIQFSIGEIMCNNEYRNTANIHTIVYTR